MASTTVECEKFDDAWGPYAREEQCWARHSQLIRDFPHLQFAQFLRTGVQNWTLQAHCEKGAEST